MLVFEDLHWADEALLSFLEHLADWAEGVPLLLLCTARPELYERHPGFGANARNAQRINLAPLYRGGDRPPHRSAARAGGAAGRDAAGSCSSARAAIRSTRRSSCACSSDRGELGEAVGGAGLGAGADRRPPRHALTGRKSLLQDAAVVGKVFWAGALAEMGEPRAARGRARPARARAQGARACRALLLDGGRARVRLLARARAGRLLRADPARRPCRPSPCRGSVDRARRRASASEDLADVLAHHYVQALELARAAGQTQETQELEARAIRYLALAGERALSLDVDRAEQHLARALDACPRRTTPSAPRCSSAGPRQSNSRAGCRKPDRRSNRRSTSIASRASPWRPAAS